MKFIAPEYLYCLAAALVLAAAALVFAAWRRRREMQLLFADPAAAGTALRLSRGARRVRIVCLAGALTAAAIAAARPYWKSQERTVTGKGRDIAVVFDVSKSMLARDLPPSRLEHAKFLLRQLAQKCAGDRLALIAFAGEAFAACPLTADPVAFDEYVDELKPELVPRGGTDLEKALREALKCLKGAAGSQAIVLVTDGDELTGAVEKVLPELEKRGIPLCVAGLGDPAAGAPLPDETGALRRDSAGKLITSRLHESALKRLAAATGGVYVRSTVADPGAEVIASRLAKLAGSDRDEHRKVLPEERFDWFVMAAAVLLMASLLISERSRRALIRAAGCFLAAGLCLGAATPPANAEVPDEELAAAPTPEALYNLGRGRQEKGDLAGARRCYERLLQLPDPRGRARAKALLNMGVAEHRAAREEFQSARRLVAGQQLDPALAKLDAALAKLDAATGLYGAALAGTGASALDADGAAGSDLCSRERDAERIAELKKRIEELKKAQRQAQQSARNARDKNKNRQDKPQQKQQPQQNKQDKQDKQRDRQDRKDQPQTQDRQQQDKQQSQQNQQNKQDNPRQNQQGEPNRQGGDGVPREEIRDAAQRSEELKKQAESLGQKQLSEQAQRAAGELRRAEQAPDRKSAQPHLERAMRELGEPDPRDEKRDRDKNKEGKQDKNRDDGEPRQDKEDQPGEGKAPAPTAEKPSGEAKDAGTEQLLQLLNDEERRHREELNRRRRFRRPEVERDW